MGILLALLLAGALLTQSWSTGVVHAASQLDQEFDSGTIGPIVGGGADAAQTFTVGLDGLLTEVQVRAGRIGGAPLLVDVRRTTGGAPIEDDSDTLASVTVPAADVSVNVSGSPPPFLSIDVSGFGVSVSAGQVLAIVLRQPVAGGFYALGAGIGNPYGAGDGYTRFESPSWFNGGYDLDFRTFVDPEAGKAEILKDSGVPGEGLDNAPGLQKAYNDKSKAADNAGKKK